MTLRAAARVLAHGGRFLAELARGWPEHARQGGTLPPWRRAREQAVLLVMNGITAADYYRFRLDRAELPWARKREFLGSFERHRWQHRMNPRFYRAFSDDKVMSHRFLAQLGLPVPRLLGVIGPSGQAETGEPLRTPDDLGTWLAACRLEHFVLKPVLGTFGAGVLVLGRALGSGEWERVPGGRIDVAGLAAHLVQYRHQPYFLIEERLFPHPELAKFAPDVIHTARVLSGLDGDVEIIDACLRINLGEDAVDNFSKGNLAVPIDPRTGRLGRAVRKAEALVSYAAHPANGTQIEGTCVPDWEQMVGIVTRAARATPFNPVQGWDIAFTDHGPVITEANGLWGLDINQVAPDRGLLATTLRGYLARHDLLRGDRLAWVRILSRE